MFVIGMGAEDVDTDFKLLTLCTRHPWSHLCELPLGHYQNVCWSTFFGNLTY